MTNPFENPDGEFIVLVNDDGQHSLWPTFRDAPQGWTAATAPGTREGCLMYIDQHWTDIRPKRLVENIDPSE